MVNSNQNNTLLLDIGNTSMKWAMSYPEELFDMRKICYPENLSSEFFKECLKESKKPKNILVSCVAEENAWQFLERACDELWNIKAKRILSSKEGYGLINAYDDAKTLGSDRWCAMIGGLDLAESTFVIIDAGSALTIDVVNEFGKHLGGYILPGVMMMKKSLGLNTAQIAIDNTKNELPSVALANSTSRCIDAGIHLSITKLIEAVIEKLLMQATKTTCLITGGDANTISQLLSSKYAIIPDLVLQGLAVIAKNELDNR